MSTHLPDPFRASPGGALSGLPGDAPLGPERRERRAWWPFYRSGYVSAFLAGRLEDGGDFALAAGAHGRHYPFYHPRSRWDDLLLVAGERRLLAAGRRLPPLSLVLGAASAVISYHGLTAVAGGTLVDVDLNLELHATTFPARSEGLGWGNMLLGLRWQPALLHGRGMLALNGARRGIELIAGEIERGTLRSLRWAPFRIAYDYTGITRAGGQPAAQVSFRAWPLARGMAGAPLRLLLALTRARECLTLAGEAVTRGDPRHIAPSEHETVEPLVESTVDLGPARLARQLVRVGPATRPRWGLREIFTPKR